MRRVLKMVNTYNEDVQMGCKPEPYSKEEIELMKDTNYISPIRFKRLLATLDEWEKVQEDSKDEK
jgi:hypothetical protein